MRKKLHESYRGKSYSYELEPRIIAQDKFNVLFT